MNRGPKLSTTPVRLAVGVAAGWALLALCLFAYVLVLFLIQPTDFLPVKPLDYVFVAAVLMVPGGPPWLLLHWLRPRLAMVGIAVGAYYAIGLVVFVSVWFARESVGLAVSVGEIVLGITATALILGLCAGLIATIVWRTIYGRQQPS